MPIDYELLHSLNKKQGTQPNPQIDTTNNLDSWLNSRKQRWGSSNPTTEFEPEKVTSNIDKVVNFFSNAGDAITGLGAEAAAAVPAIAEYGMKQAQRLAENPIGVLTEQVVSNPLSQIATKVADTIYDTNLSQVQNIATNYLKDKTKGVSTWGAVDKVTGNKLSEANANLASQLKTYKDEFRKKIPDSFWGRLGASAADMVIVGGASVGAGFATGNPQVASAVAMGLSSALEGGALYDTLKEKGLSEDEALKVSGQWGALIGLLDSYVPGKLGAKAAGEMVKKTSGNVLKRMAKSETITEIGTENLQNLISTAVEYNYSTDAEREELIKRIPEEALETTAMSALMGGAMQVVGKGLDSKNKKDKTKLEEEFGTGEEIQTPQVEEIKLTPEQQLKKVRKDAISAEYKSTVKNIDDNKAEIRREVNRLNGELKIAKNNDEIVDEKRISGELLKLKKQLKNLDNQRKTAKEDAIKKIDEVENLKENEEEIKLLNARKANPELSANASEPNYRTQPLAMEERYDATKEMKLVDKIKQLRAKINEPKTKNKKELKAELKRSILQLNEISRVKANKQLSETNFEQQTADLPKLTPTETTELQTPEKGMEVKAKGKTPVIEETKYEMRKSKGGWSVDKKENDNWGFVQQFRTKKEAQNYIDSKQKPEVSNVTKEKGETLLVKETPKTLTKEEVKSKEGKTKKNKAKYAKRKPQNWQEAVALHLINGGTIKADQYTRQELMDNFGLSPFQVSNKSGLRLDTALSELGFVSKEQFNDPYFSQEDLVKDFLRKYNTNEKRKEFLDYDIDQKFIERLTPEEQIEENIASYLSKKYYDADGFPIYDAIEKNADKILKETGANKEQLDNFIKAQKEIENEIVSFNIEDFKDPLGDGYLVPIDNLIKRGILNERDIESKIANTGREESGVGTAERSIEKTESLKSSQPSETTVKTPAGEQAFLSSEMAKATALQPKKVKTDVGEKGSPLFEQKIEDKNQENMFKQSKGIEKPDVAPVSKPKQEVSGEKAKRIISEDTYQSDKKKATDILNRPGSFPSQLEAMPYFTRMGAYHLENLVRAGIEKGRQFTEWTKSYIKDLGGKIRPYLKKIWDETLRQFGKKLLQYSEKNPFVRNMNVVEGSLFTNDNLPPVQKYTDKDLEVLFEKNPVVRKKVSEFAKKTKETADDILRPMSAEIEQIDKDTYTAIKKNDFETLAETNRRIKQITPFLEKLVRFRKYQPKEFAKLSYYLTANNMVEAEKIMSKWRMSEAFKPVRDVLNELYVEGVKVKYDLGYLKDYFPRDMVDYEGYLKEIRGKKAFDVFQELIDKKNAERKKKGEAVLTTDEEDKLITNAIRGYNPGISLSGIANYKERVIKAFPPSYAKYYDTAENALINYIVKATDAIQQRKLFGYGVDAEASIASYIKGKGLDAEKSAKLKRILKARYNFMSNKWASQVRGIMYLTTLNNPTSSIKNLADVPMALYNSGSLTKTFVALGRALVNKSVIKMEDAGLHNMGGEYMNLSSRNKATNAMMKWMLAFPYFDKVGKETYINATMSKYHKLANSNPDKLKTKLGKWFNEERTSQIISDLRQKKSYKDIYKTNLLNLVAYLEISDVQPTTMTEMPLKYAESPNGRVLYTMKSFQLKRLDFFRKETLHKIRTKGQRLEGLRNLAMLTTMIGLGEAGTEQIISWLLGRDESFTEQIADSMLSIIGFNRYDVEKAKRTNPIDVVFNKALPIATPLKDLWDDYETAADNYELTRYLTTHKTDRPFKAKSLNALPWVRTIRKNIENR